MQVYFRQTSVKKIGVVCRVDDVIYYGEGSVEIKKLESGPREIKVEGSVSVDYGWITGLAEDIIIYGENTAAQSGENSEVSANE